MRIRRLPLLLLAIAGSGAHAGPRVSVSAGTEWSVGRYGEAVRTTILDSPVSIRLRAGGWSLGASTSHVLVDGPAPVVVADGGGTGDVADRPITERQSGIGDTGLSAAYTADELGGTSLFVALGARTRLPTGSLRRGLGVGAVDYMLSVESGVSRSRWGASAKATRRLLGDTALYARRDGWQMEGDVWLVAGRGVQLGADYEHRQSAFRGGTALRVADAWASVPLSRRLRLQATGTLGFSRTAADRAIALNITRRL